MKGQFQQSCGFDTLPHQLVVSSFRAPGQSSCPIRRLRHHTQQTAGAPPLRNCSKTGGRAAARMLRTFFPIVEGPFAIHQKFHF